MSKYTTLTLKRETYETLKKVSDLTRTPIAQILTDFALNLEKALNDVDSEHFNVFNIAFGYDSSKRVLIAKILESIFGYSMQTQREIERQTKKIIRDAIKKRKKEGVLA